MGRRGLSRSIRRTPPSPEALERYLHLWVYEEAAADPQRDLPLFCSQAFFGSAMPLELEVGCGTGEFLCDLAAERPQVGFVGVDPSTRSLYHAVRLAAQAKLGNIRFVRAPVAAIYPRLVPEALSAVYVHFPDPFVRSRRQHKVLNSRFFAHLHTAMVPGATLSVVSDDTPLLEEALALVENDPRWERAHPERLLTGFEPRVKSRYQRKWERFELVARRFELRKRSA